MTPNPCDECNGTGFKGRSSGVANLCPNCVGMAYFGIEPRLPCPSPPGSDEKVAWLKRRYQEGVALWNGRDATFEEAC